MLSKSLPEVGFALVSAGASRVVVLAQIPLKLQDKINANQLGTISFVQFTLVSSVVLSVSAALEPMGGKGGGNAAKAQGQSPNVDKVELGLQVARDYAKEKGVLH